jgi:hypothetical protein
VAGVAVTADAILIDLNPEYSAMQRERVTQDAPMFAEVTQ